MYAWYNEEWWLLGDDGDHACTPEQRNSVMEYVLGPLNYEFIMDESAVAETGIVSPP